jgi:hypothetical protein
MASGTVSVQTIGSSKNFIPTAKSRKIDHRFFTIMAFAMAAGIFAGFTPTYYARTQFHSPVIPFWVQVHAAVFTAWTLLYLLQNLLAMNAGMRLHRRLGIVGAVLAPAVVTLGMTVTLREAGEGRSFPFPDVYSLVAVSSGQMLLFAAMIATALWQRRDGETHKRLILMANQLFFFPAFGRLFQGINPITLVLALCFYFAGPIYDLITRRRIHPAYRWGVPFLILTMPPFGVIFSHLPIWRDLVSQVLNR